MEDSKMSEMSQSRRTLNIKGPLELFPLPEVSRFQVGPDPVHGNEQRISMFVIEEVDLKELIVKVC